MLDRHRKALTAIREEAATEVTELETAFEYTMQAKKGQNLVLQGQKRREK